MSSTTQTIADYTPFIMNGGGNSSIGSALSNVAWQWAASFIASEAITVSAVAISVASKTGTPVAYTIDIETDNGSGRPSGTLAWGGATTTLAANASTGWTAELTLTTPGPLTIGTLYHLVVKPQTDPASANYISVQSNAQVYPIQGLISSVNITCYTSYNNGSWTTPASLPVFMLISNDATPKRIGNPFSGNSSLIPTNTLWAGAKFVAPDNITVFAGALTVIGTSTANVTMFLLDNSNNQIATSGALGAGIFTAWQPRSPIYIPFTTPVALTKGNTYRLVIKDSASAQRLEYATTPSATYQTVAVGPNLMLTQGTSADGTASPTTWTDTATSLPGFSLKANTVTTSGGSGVAKVFGSGVIVPTRSSK